MVLYPLTIMLPGVTGMILIFRLFNILLTIAGFTFAIFYPIYWHRKESKTTAYSSVRHAWFRGIIRY